MAFLLSLSATFYILHNISAFFLLDMCCKSIALFPLLYIPFDTEILLTVFILSLISYIQALLLQQRPKRNSVRLVISLLTKHGLFREDITSPGCKGEVLS